MTKLTTWISTCIMAAGLAAPGWAGAASNNGAVCTVTVDYLVNGTLTEAYGKDFVVEEATPFADDFSTPIRQKQFNATLTKDAGKLVVVIDYFNDVGVFVAIDLNARLTIHGGAFETTSGTHTFSSSQAIPAGNHTTNYTLVCRRA